MKYSTKLVLKMFLDLDIKRSRIMGDKIDLEFYSYFTDNDLRDIIKWLKKRNQIADKFIPKLPHIERLANKELVEIIEKRSNILAYFLNVWRFENDYIYQPDGIKSFFERFDLQSHYLHKKSPLEWSKSDYNKYRELLLKYGYLIKAYGIYDAVILQDDVLQITSAPNRFFDTYEEAQKAIDCLVKDKTIKQKDVHILFILVHT